jgi:putative chitobiose transport system permease protein
MYAYLFLAPALVILAVFLAAPMAQVLRISFMEFDPYQGSARWIGASNYARLLEDPEFRVALANSFKYLLVTPVLIGLSLGLAVLVEPRLPGVNFFRAAYYIPVVTTTVAVGITWRFIFREDTGLLNTVLTNLEAITKPIPWMTDSRLALLTAMTVTVWRGLGYYMVIFIAALRSIPSEQIEAAIVDGARPSQVFLRVKLPMLWPAITLVAVISSLSALQVFDEIYIMTNGKIRGAITVVYYIYESAFDLSAGTQDYGYASAMAVAMFCVLLVFTGLNLILMRRSGYAGE